MAFGTDKGLTPEQWERMKHMPGMRGLLGCSWGTLVTSPEDSAECLEMAVQVVIIHNPHKVASAPEEAFSLKLCAKHLAVIEENTDDHLNAVPEAGS